MKEIGKYAEQWNVSSKYFYDNGYYTWMAKKLVDYDTVLEVEKKLTKKFHNYSLSRLHHQLVLFGRYKCKSKNPECITCPFKEICNYYKKKKH